MLLCSTLSQDNSIKSPQFTIKRVTKNISNNADRDEIKVRTTTSSSHTLDILRLMLNSRQEVTELWK